MSFTRRWGEGRVNAMVYSTACSVTGRRHRRRKEEGKRVAGNELQLHTSAFESHHFKMPLWVFKCVCVCFARRIFSLSLSLLLFFSQYGAYFFFIFFLWLFVCLFTLQKRQAHESLVYTNWSSLKRKKKNESNTEQNTKEKRIQCIKFALPDTETQTKHKRHKHTHIHTHTQKHLPASRSAPIKVTHRNARQLALLFAFHSLALAGCYCCCWFLSF